MSERAALVTGATGGIGAAIAAGLAADGHNITITGRRADRLDELATELRQHGHQVKTVGANLTDDDEIARVADEHRAAFGRLDVLVNSAGGGIMAPLEVTKTRHVDLQVNLNLRSLILMFQACLPELQAAAADAGQANVVNVSSAAGKRGQRGLAVYSAAKHGVVGFTDACNAEYGNAGIRSTVFCPGLVDTPLAAAYDVPPEDMIKTDDLVEAVRFVVRLSPQCLVPEISFLQPDGRFEGT